MYKGILILMLTISASSFSQIINIPDPVFKTMLMEHDTNGDGEIQVSEAEAVVALSLSINPDNPNKIQSLEGIEYFVNIFSLEFRQHSVESLDATMLPNLYQLICDGNEMTTINVAGLSNLEYLFILRNNISTLDLTGLDNLRWLWTDDNPISELEVPLLPSLETLFCRNNNLSELNLLPISNLTRIRCGDNQISHLDVNHFINLNELQTEDNVIANINLDGLQNLTNLNISGNLITQLNVSQTGVRNLKCANNVNLTQIFASNGIVSAAGQFDFNNLPLLDFICIDEGEENAVAQSGYNPSAFVGSGADCQLSIEENVVEKTIAVIPNPVLDLVDVQIHYEATLFQIVDVSGKRILSAADKATVESAIIKLPAGLYFLRVYQDAESTTTRFIKL